VLVYEAQWLNSPHTQASAFNQQPGSSWHQPQSLWHHHKGSQCHPNPRRHRLATLHCSVLNRARVRPHLWLVEIVGVYEYSTLFKI